MPQQLTFSSTRVMRISVIKLIGVTMIVSRIENLRRRASEIVKSVWSILALKLACRTQVSTATSSDAMFYAFLDRSNTAGLDKTKVKVSTAQWKTLLPKPWWLLMELVSAELFMQMINHLQTWLYGFSENLQKESVVKQIFAIKGQQEVFFREGLRDKPDSGEKHDATTSCSIHTVIIDPHGIRGLVTTEENAQKKNDVKARSMLLMALLNEHLMTFNQYKDAKTLFAVIQIRFVGFRRFTNEVNTANEVSTAKTQCKDLLALKLGTTSTKLDLEQIHEDDIEEMDLKCQLALLSMRTKRFFQKTGRKVTINGSDTTEYDKSKVEYFNFHKMGHFVRACRGPRNQDSRNRNQDSSRRTVNVEEISSKAMVAIHGSGFDWSYMANDEVPTNMAFMDFSDFEANCNYLQRERVVSRNNYSRVNYHYSTKKVHPSAYRNIVPRAVLMKTSLRLLNTARLVNTAHPKTTVYNARPMSCFFESAQSTVKRPYQTRTSLTNKNFSQKVNTIKGNFYTARPKAVNTARPNSAVFNAVRANQVIAVKASACWVWRPTKLNSALITLKKHNYVNARGKSKSVVAWVPKGN
ncbi:hypothetical protein Tco_0417851 [Tanacetum coccineum]